ncbi:hypothetical protein M0802_001026 [Mischocyttarus mexicanus]|nr:hypothetical protein M0802_001026 [Mischocyttarus mexicanus]
MPARKRTKSVSMDLRMESSPKEEMKEKGNDFRLTGVSMEALGKPQIIPYPLGSPRTAYSFVKSFSSQLASQPGCIARKYEGRREHTRGRRQGLGHVAQYRTTPRRTTLRHTTPHHTTQHNTILHYTMPQFAVEVIDGPTKRT